MIPKLVIERRHIQRVTIVLAASAAGAAAGLLVAGAVASAPALVEAVVVAATSALAAHLVEIALAKLWEARPSGALAAAA